MLRRHIEVRTERARNAGRDDVLKYNATVWDDQLPPPFPYPPHGPDGPPGGRSCVTHPAPARFVAGQGWVELV